MNATGTEARVCQDIADRQAKGIAKYGTSVEGNPLLKREWLQHAYEEALDLAIYLKRCMEEMDDYPETGKPLSMKGLVWGGMHGMSGRKRISMQGERNHKAKLTEAKVRSIRADHANGLSCGEIAPCYGISTRTVHKIIARALWAWVQ